MIFADKLIQLRKKSGWSQEELAEQMGVTRQSVSKWEGAQSVPDLEKMIMLSRLFGVSTDYLLKDELEDGESPGTAQELPRLRRVSMEEASDFLAVKAATARTIAQGVMLCILSPVCILVLGGMSETGGFLLAENTAGGVGIIVLLCLVAAAVALFISSGSRTEAYKYLEEEIFETEYGVPGMVNERRERFRAEYTRSNIIGTGLCILSLVPLFAGIVVDENNEMLMVMAMAIMLVLVSLGVRLFVRVGIVWESFNKLLQEGDYTRHKKQRNSALAPVATVYWCVVTAAFLAYSLATRSWERSWIIWVVAGVLYPALTAICGMIIKKK